MTAAPKIHINFDPYHLRLSTSSHDEAQNMIDEIMNEGRDSRLIVRNKSTFRMYDVYESEVNRCHNS